MIPLSVPNISGKEWEYIKECLDTNWVSSVGSYVTRFEQDLAKFTGAKFAVATSNGSSALHIALMLAGVKPNDLVIAPNITFVASTNTISYCGAQPVLMDVCADNWQMDPVLLEEFLSVECEITDSVCVYKKTGQVVRAIMPVHILGNMGNINRILSVAKKFCLTVVEDSTESLGSYFNERHSGTFGLLGAFSFNGNKIITTGGGGMIVTDNEELAKKAKHLTTQAKASVDDYYHDETGYNYRLVNVLAAMGVAQMEQLPAFLIRKKEISLRYKEALSKFGDMQFQQTLPEVKPNNWLFTIHTSKKKELLALLKQEKIEARSLWVPMNRLPMLSNSVYYSNNNISDALFEHCLSLPCSTNITDTEVDKVIEIVSKVFA